MKTLWKQLIITVAVCICSNFAGAETPVLTSRAPASIELRDQYDSPQKLSFPTTNITVLTIADRKGAEQLDDWIELLKHRYDGRISLRGLADVGGAPKFLHARIRKKFQETRPYPVMMDWSGKISGQWNYKKDVANLVVLNREGAILGRFSGPASRSATSELFATLDKALSKPAAR